MARAAPRADIYLSMSRLLEDISEKESRHQPAASQIAKWLGLLGSLCRARFNRMNSFGARPVERVMTAGTNREIDESYASLVRERADALLVSGGMGSSTAGAFNWRCWLCATPTCDVFSARLYRSWQADKLWDELCGYIPTDGQLFRPGSQGD